MKSELGDSIVGIMMVPLGLLGLVLASRAMDLEITVFGWSLAVFAAVFGFGVVKRHFDHANSPAARSGGQSEHV